MGRTTMDISDERLFDVPLERRLEILDAVQASVAREVDGAELADGLLAKAFREAEADWADFEPPPPWQDAVAELRARTAEAGVDRQTAGLIAELVELPVEERIRIAQMLTTSFVEGGIFPISDELADELDREFNEHLADPASSIPWESVRGELRNLFR